MGDQKDADCLINNENDLIYAIGLNEYVCRKVLTGKISQDELRHLRNETDRVEDLTFQNGVFWFHKFSARKIDTGPYFPRHQLLVALIMDASDISSLTSNYAKHFLPPTMEWGPVSLQNCDQNNDGNWGEYQEYFLENTGYVNQTTTSFETLQRNVCRPEEKQEDSNCRFIIPDMFSEKELSSNEKVHYLLSVLGRFSFYTDEKDEDDSSDVQRLRQAVQNYRFGVTNTEPIFNIVCALLTMFTVPWKNSVLNLVRMSCLILSLYHPLSHKE
jgi:hypothetical protein